MKRKGFTLIELLAVIVILGLLMAIAIPSVTKYLTQSRKKTLTTTIGNYASALVAEVNNMEYIFTETNTIYAVPVECVEVERGGTNPFGQWSPATENHWAYILVQYNDESSSYTYGFTFKDSAGYGLYPITLEKLKESGSQIQTDLKFNIPKTGSYTNFVDSEAWERSGFNVNDDTVIKIHTKENDACSVQKICTGTGTNVGDIITCGSEEFYVIEDSASTIKVLSRYSIDTSTYKQTRYPGEPTKFADSNYWVEDNQLKSQYGTSYPANIFDSNTHTYSVVMNYQKYLRKEQGLTSASARLITFDELIALGCSKEKATCTTGQSWLVTNFHWHVGTASDNTTFYRVTSGVGDFYGFWYTGNHWVRPVVTINKDEIKFNQRSRGSFFVVLKFDKKLL